MFLSRTGRSYPRPTVQERLVTDGSGTWRGHGTLVNIVAMLAGRYRLVERLGAGGMSVVWRAYDEVLGRRVAVKVLSSAYAADPTFRAGIRREARAAARLSHPNITNVYDYGEAVGEHGEPVPFVVMELVEGHSLAQRLAGGAMPWREVLDIGRQVASALALAHATGLVHRDVTPANIMLTAGGVKVVDFGIAAVVGERGEQIVLGTPAYLAPERRTGAPAQPATDAYGLGMVLYHALAGGLPPTPMPPGVPAPVAALVMQCLAPDPGGRPDTRTLAERLAVLGGAAVPVPGPAAAAAVRVPPGSGTRRLPVSGGTRPLPEPSRPVPPAAPRVRPRRRRGRLLFLVALVSVVLLLLWGFSTLRSQPPQALPLRSPAPSPTRARPSPTPDQLVCTVGYRVSLDVGSYFTAQLTLQNTGKLALKGWTLGFDFPQDQHVTAGWPGVWDQKESHVTVHDLVYNRTIAQGASIKMSFVGSHHTGTNDAPRLFTVNGVRCQQAVEG